MVSAEFAVSALTVFTVSVLAHAVLLPGLGYYWDDWLMVWIGHAQGPGSLAYQMSWDRPFHGVYSAFVYSLLGDHPLRWHVYIFGLVFLSALVLLWALRGLWPKQGLATTSITLLYVIYPGFLGFPLGHIYHVHFFVTLLGAFSLGATIRAQYVRNRRNYEIFTLIAFASGLVYLFMYELFISFEGLRLLLIAYIAWRQKRKTPRKLAVYLLRRWLPYVSIILVFLIWRVFIYDDSFRDKTNLDLLAQQYIQQPLSQAVRVPGDLIRNFLETSVFAWFVPAQSRLHQAAQTALFASVLLGLIGGGVVIGYARWVRKRTPLTDVPPAWSLTWGRDTLLVGVLATALGLLPIVLADQSVRLLQLTDRFSLHVVVPVAIAVVGLIYTLLTPMARPWVVAFLVGIATVTHVNNANYYRNIWNEQKALWWQMFWRVPALKPGTVLAMSVPPQSFFPADTYEVWAPANLIYAPQTREPAIYGVRLTEKVADSIVRDESLDYNVLMNVQFTMDFSHVLLLSAPSDTSCLHIVDRRHLQELPHDAPAILSWVGVYSNTEQILDDVAPPTMPREFFGHEPPHSWCYYFQKAELAQQRGDWETASRLGDEVREKGFQPEDVVEWLPFITAYAAVGRCEDARLLTKVVLKEQPYLEGQVLPETCRA
ncbi:MAG: hypothetical protein HZC41_08185 [Chloroflexi bacterium]|nr:hypothetical protein [Chloroflexota bacterium]